MPLKLAFRQLTKNRAFSALNIAGLAVGLAACLLLFRIVWFERSHNRSFQNFDRIARIVTEETLPDGTVEPTACIPIPAMEAMAISVPQFEAFSRMREFWPTVIVPNPAGGPPLKKVAMDGPELGFFAEPAFLKIFDFNWLAGDAATALNDLNSTVLTQKLAEKCFGSPAAALGQTVLLDNLVPVTVRGVVANLPENCDLPFVLLVSYSTLKPNSKIWFYDEDWGACSSNNQAFALLKNRDQTAAANTALGLIGDNEYRTQNDGKQKSKTHFLQPLAALHFDEKIGHSGSHRMSENRLAILSAIGGLILLMACFNFINLSTAQALGRAREVGVRKTLGSSRGQLIRQFMTETGLIVLISALIACILAVVASPLLERISDVPTSWPFFSEPSVWLFLGSAVVVVTVLSGLYPALILAGFQPVRALKNEQKMGGVSLRKALVVAQFVIAQGLIVGTLVTISQLDFIQNRDLGFKKDLILNFNIPNDSAEMLKMDRFKQQLLALPGVESASFSSDQPASSNTWSTNFKIGRGTDDAPFNTSLKFTDEDYQKTYGLQLLAGRWLEKSDTIREVLVNETMLRKLGISPDDALQKEVMLGRNRWRKVVGVVKDFHSHSLHTALEPLILGCRKQFYNDAAVKIRPDQMAATTAGIQRVFDETYPAQVFDSGWYDETVANFYRDEARFSALCKGFAGLAVLIACLGLFGLATHAAARRTKEIGVRKVLGASVGSLVGLLSKDFLKLVVVAIFIASPLAFYFMKKWLADFAFRIDIEVWFFVAAGFAAVAIAFLTVSFQSIKAALANPVKSLRSE